MPMVRINIDCEDENWGDRALRVLQAGGALVGVPDDRVEALVAAAREAGVEVEARESDAEGGWSLEPV